MFSTYSSKKYSRDYKSGEARETDRTSLIFSVSACPFDYKKSKRVGSDFFSPKRDENRAGSFGRKKKRKEEKEVVQCACFEYFFSTLLFVHIHISIFEKINKNLCLNATNQKSGYLFSCIHFNYITYKQVLQPKY